MVVVFRNCEHCGHNVDAHFGIYSGLGPRWRRCSKCGTRYPTGRQEWADLGVGWQVWFVIYSLIAAVLTGGLAGIMAAATFGAVHDVSWVVDLGRYWIIGVLWGMGWGVLVVALQAFRAISSLHRSEAGDRVYNGPFWNLHVDVGVKVMGGLFASMIVAALLGLISRL